MSWADIHCFRAWYLALNDARAVRSHAKEEKGLHTIYRMFVLEHFSTGFLRNPLDLREVIQIPKDAFKLFKLRPRAGLSFILFLAMATQFDRIFRGSSPELGSELDLLTEANRLNSDTS
jgi:hypothetical protein